MSDIEFREHSLACARGGRDSRAAATAVRRAIEEFKIGCEVTEVQTGERCLEELASRRYHVAFVDVIFPRYQRLRCPRPGARRAYLPRSSR